jgi:uncharacterized protein YebE (UPF0316 family)
MYTIACFGRLSVLVESILYNTFITLKIIFALKERNNLVIYMSITENTNVNMKY